MKEINCTIYNFDLCRKLFVFISLQAELAFSNNTKIYILKIEIFLEFFAIEASHYHPNFTQFTEKLCKNSSKTQQ